MRDRTTVNWMSVACGGITSGSYEILYDDYDRYEDLPRAAQCDEIKREFEEYKAYKKSLKVLERLERQVGRFR